MRVKKERHSPKSTAQNPTKDSRDIPDRLLLHYPSILTQQSGESQEKF